jgi:hypothetical protein
MKWDSFSLERLLKGFSKIQDRSNSFSARNTIRLPGAYALSTKKKSNCLKILNQKYACTSHQCMLVREVSWKIDIFYGLCKKTKKMSCQKPYFSINFILFLHMPCHKSIFSKTTLCACRMGKCTLKYFVQFLWHFKMRPRCILNKREHMHP